MNPSVVIPPYAEPVSLEEMKLQLKIELDVVDDDALVSALITTARNFVEAGTGACGDRSKIMVDTTFDYFLDSFPGTWIAIPRVPLVSVSSITYLDSAGDSQTLATSVYTVDIAKGCIYLAYNQTWPSTYAVPNAITIRFVAGQAAPFTVTTSTEVLTISGRTFTAGDRVRVLNSGGSLPPSFAPNTDYWVVAGPSLSLTSGGAAIDITGVGSGTHFIGLDLAGFQALRTVIKLLVSHWYENREPVLQSGAIPKPLPFAIEALLMNELA